MAKLKNGRLTVKLKRVPSPQLCYQGKDGTAVYLPRNQFGENKPPDAVEVTVIDPRWPYDL